VQTFCGLVEGETLLQVGLLATVSVINSNSLKYWQVGNCVLPAPDLVASSLFSSIFGSSSSTLSNAFVLF